MVFVCSICTSSLNTRPPEVLPGVNVELMTTRCGHLFHLVCLNNWFNRQDHPARHCPNCNEVLAAADTIIVRPSGDNDADEDTLIQENIRLKAQVDSIQEEINQTQILLFETLDKSGIEKTQNDMLCREIEKLEMHLRKFQRKNEETDEMLKVNADSFKTELTKLTKEKRDLEENLERAEASGIRLKLDLDEQLRFKNQRIADLEVNANELRKSNEYWRQQHNRLRRRDGHVDQDDDFMMSQATQTYNPEMQNLDERLQKYKRCMDHMQSEYNILDKMRLREAAATPISTPQAGPRSFRMQMEKLAVSGNNWSNGLDYQTPPRGLFNGNGSGDTGLLGDGYGHDEQDTSQYFPGGFATDALFIGKGDDQILRPGPRRTQDVKPKIELSASAPPFQPSNPPPAKVFPKNSEKNSTFVLVPNGTPINFDASANVKAKVDDDFGFLRPKLNEIDDADEPDQNSHD